MDVYQNLKGNSWPEKAGNFSNDRLEKHLENFGYEPMRHTPALWNHTSHEIVFTLIMNDFGVKYQNKKGSLWTVHG